MMKRSGMRWRHAGGQGILTLRALHQSERFARAWKLLSSTYQRIVGLLLQHIVVADNCRVDRDAIVLERHSDVV